MKSTKSSGFTLIELMIVVVIVAILAMIAYPSYLGQVRKSRRADCEGALMGFANAMERHFTENSTYLGAAGTATAPANTGTPHIYAKQCPVDGGTATYTLKIASNPAPTANTYTLQAIPVPTGPQASDKCGTLTLDQAGAKGQAAGYTVDDCWQ